MSGALPRWLEKQQALDAADNSDVVSDIFPLPTKLPTTADPAKAERVYEWVKYDNIWEVAHRLGLDAKQLMEHNGIDSPENLQPGDKLHLYADRKLSKDPVVRYELLPAPLPMHVSVVSGTHKFLFGNIKRWEDLSHTGPLVKFNTNVDIVAIAHVPIGTEVATYFMEASALGDYAATGRVEVPRGFNHTHLTTGHIDTTKAPAPVLVEALPAAINILTEPEAPLPDFAEEEDEDDSLYGPNTWKSTYEPFPTSLVYRYKRNTEVFDLDGLRGPKLWPKGREELIAGRFWKADQEGHVHEYYRPYGVKYWFGINPEALELISLPLDPDFSDDLPADLVADTDLTFEERVQAGPKYQSFIMRYWSIPLIRSATSFSKAAARYTEFINGQINKK